MYINTCLTYVFNIQSKESTTHGKKVKCKGQFNRFLIFFSDVIGWTNQRKKYKKKISQEKDDEDEELKGEEEREGEWEDRERGREFFF